MPKIFFLIGWFRIWYLFVFLIGGIFSFFASLIDFILFICPKQKFNLFLVKIENSFLNIFQWNSKKKSFPEFKIVSLRSDSNEKSEVVIISRNKIWRCCNLKVPPFLLIVKLQKWSCWRPDLQGDGSGFRVLWPPCQGRGQGDQFDKVRMELINDS